MSKDAFYFSHDSNAKDDPKCSMLIEQLGLEGYGIYWVLVEVLRDQPGYRYPLSMLPIIARKYNTTAEKVRVVIGNYGLFVVTDDDFFLSESLCRRMDAWEETKEAKRIAGRKSGAARRLASGVPDEARSSLPQVYVLRCFGDNEEFIKIGCTNGTISRRLSSSFPYSYTVLRQFFSKESVALERELHEKFSGYKYWTNIKFAGDAECYDMTMLDEIMSYTPMTSVEDEHCSNTVQTQLELIKEKKIKEKKIDITPLQNAIMEFVALRRKMRKPMTDHAIDLFRKELDKLANTDEEKIAIINQSIMRGWMGVFPLKDQQKPNNVINMRGYVDC